MGINLNLDYTSLFASLSGGSSSGSSGISTDFLTDYASIQNGSYGRLLKSYYNKNEFDKSSVLDKDNINNTKESAKELAAVKTDAKELGESADKLTASGSKSLFKTDDRDAIYKAAQSLAKEYNSLLDSAGKTDSESILRTTKNMTTMTKGYKSLLSSAGIEVGSDNKLTVDEEAFKKANFSTLKSLFNGNTSFSYNVSARASMIGYSAESESNKGNLYNGAGGFNNLKSSGSLFDSYL